MDDDAVGGVLDEELEALGDIRGDPGDVAGLGDVGHDPEEPRRTGLGHRHGADEHPVHLAVGRLELLDQLVGLPGDPGLDRIDDGREHGVAELAAAHRSARRARGDQVRTIGGGSLQQA